MIYVTVNVETGELLNISDEPVEVSGAPLMVRPMDRGRPDFSKEEWVPNLLNFVPLPEARVLTRRAYLGLFTQEERVAIRVAAKNFPALEDYLELLSIAEYIDLDDPDVEAGLTTLEAAGLLSPGRAAEILA